MRPAAPAPTITHTPRTQSPDEHAALLRLRARLQEAEARAEKAEGERDRLRGELAHCATLAREHLQRAVDAEQARDVYERRADEWFALLDKLGGELHAMTERAEKAEQRAADLASDLKRALAGGMAGLYLRATFTKSAWHEAEARATRYRRRALALVKLLGRRRAAWCETARLAVRRAERAEKRLAETENRAGETERTHYHDLQATMGERNVAQDTADRMEALCARLSERLAVLVRATQLLPADDVDGATLEWYAAKFESKLGHTNFGQRLRSYAATLRGWVPRPVTDHEPETDAEVDATLRAAGLDPEQVGHEMMQAAFRAALGRAQRAELEASALRAALARATAEHDTPCATCNHPSVQHTHYEDHDECEDCINQGAEDPCNWYEPSEARAALAGQAAEGESVTIVPKRVCHDPETGDYVCLNCLAASPVAAREIVHVRGCVNGAPIVMGDRSLYWWAT